MNIKIRLAKLTETHLKQLNKIITMKKIILILILLCISYSSFAQNVRWSDVSFSFSKGPVSPEYQYSYNIIISEDGSAKLVYTKSNASDEYEFKVGKKGLKKLNKALKNSKIFTVNPDEMKSENNKIGGPERSITVTKWQSPELDAKPETITVPSNVNDTYAKCINSLYDTIEMLVPASIWNKAKGE